MEIGRPVPMLDGVARVTGTLPYAINLKLPGMLTVKVLRSLFPHATITKIDSRAAEQLDGVTAVLTQAGIEPHGKKPLIYGAFLKDQPVVAGEKVRYIGEPLALVAAESADIAEQAMQLIEVDYAEMPAVYDVKEAMNPGAPALHTAFPDNCFTHAKLRHGDLEAGFAAADLVLEETYTSPVAQQTSLEPHVTAAQWAEGKLTVWSATQAPSLVQRVLAELFGLDSEDVRVIVPPLGGGYGGKGHVRLEPMVAALAMKTKGRPVKLALSREEEFVTVTKHAARIRIKTGVRRDGSITARQVLIYWNGGAYADVSPALVRSSLVRALGPYRLPAAHVDAYGIYTNLPPAAAFRGAMSSQTTWAYESHMDSLAHKLGLDPLAFRLENMLREGDTFVTGEKLHDIHFVECLEAVAEGLGWEESPRATHTVAAPLDKGGEEAARATLSVAAPLERGGTESPPTPLEKGGAESPPTPLEKGGEEVRRGRGLAVMIKSMPATSKSQCRLELNDEGRVRLFTSTVEMGQGAHTALAQITADALGISTEGVTVVGPDTAITPFDSTTSASRSTTMMGRAIVSGAQDLKSRLIQAAVPLFECPPEELAAGDGAVFLRAEPEQRMNYSEILKRNQIQSLEAQGEASTQGGIDPETGQGVGSLHYHQGAGACEVAVDTQTGKVSVLRYYAASFAGRVVNPRLAQLQNDGNVIYGIGPALMEEVVFDAGQAVNPNLSDYQIPSFLDGPKELVSYALEAEGSEFHGIGEMTLPPVAPAIANAIFNATGVRILDLPITAEKVLKALQNE